jgi:hypothetical protein
MILIQVLLIIGFLIFLWWVLSNPSSYQVRAWTKILASLFVLLAILTVIFPDSTNSIAHWVGVGRGADLLLYILTLAFIFVMFNSYIQEKRLQKRIVLLARRLAIIEANMKTNKKGHN